MVIFLYCYITAIVVLFIIGLYGVWISRNDPISPSFAKEMKRIRKNNRRMNAYRHHPVRDYLDQSKKSFLD